MLDKTSEKFLKLLISKYQTAESKASLIIQGEDVRMDSYALNSVCLHLYRNGYLIDFLEASPAYNYVNISISHNGLHYFECKRKEIFKFWLPIIISALALIKSFSGELVSLLKLITQLWI